MADGELKGYKLVGGLIGIANANSKFQGFAGNLVEDDADQGSSVIIRVVDVRLEVGFRECAIEE